MELSSSGHGPGKESVTLLSYACNRSGARPSRYNPKSKCTTSYNSGAVPPVVAKKSDKFFKTFRRRSKSASRLQRDQNSPDFRGSDCSLNTLGFDDDEDRGVDPDLNKLTYSLNGRERGPASHPSHPEAPKKPDRVTLVGFASHCELDRFGVDDLALSPTRHSPRVARRRFGRKGVASLDFGGSTSNLVMSDQQNRSNFTNLRTSRDVKMERERLRQEKMSQFKQESRDLFQKMKQESFESFLNETGQRPPLLSGPSLFEERLRALELANDTDGFGQLVQENHERFLQLVREQRASAFASRLSPSPTLFGRGGGGGGGGRLSSSPALSSEEAAAVATTTTTATSSRSSSRGEGLMDSRTLANNNSRQPRARGGGADHASSEGHHPKPRVHHIQIQRENLSCEVDNNSGQVLLRKESDSKLEIIVKDENPGLAQTRSEPVIREIEVQVAGKNSTERLPTSISCDKAPTIADCEHFSDVGSYCSDDDDDVSEHEGDESRVTDLKTPSTSSTITLNKSSSQELFGDCGTSELQHNHNSNNNNNNNEPGVIIPCEVIRSKATFSSSLQSNKAKKPDHLSSVGQDDNNSSSVQRSLSSSSRLSSSSSGFSSGTSETFNQPPHSGAGPNPGLAPQKLQGAFEKRSVAYYHPTFTNHLGFGRLGTGLRAKTQSSSDVYQFRRESLQSFGNFPTFSPPFPLLISSGSSLLGKRANGVGGGESNSSGGKLSFPNSKGSITSASASNIMLSNGKVLHHQNEHNLLVTKSKSSTLESNSSTSSGESSGGSSQGSSRGSSGSDGNSASYRFTSDEMTEAMAARYGDSETESEDEDDDDLMDSVSVVAARNAVTIASLTHTKDTDSGRGESPESLSGGRVVLRPKTTPKGPRPISAVPSEYSDISTSSCRSSDGGGDHVEEACPPTPILSPKESLIEEPIAHEEEEDYASKMKRVRMIAMELLTTEEQYVQILHLIDQVFHFQVDQENRSQNLFPPETIPQMFANIKSIYQFHEEFLLPQLRERMAEWDTSDHQQRIGDIIVKFSPFFKMYTEYVKNFDNAISTINNLYQKNSKFASIMDKIHAMPECRSLSLQHHMLTPVQRIPRYEMLLKGYLHKLPQDSPDRENAEKALHLVSTAATHANEAMRRIEKFKQLLEVQESLGGTVDLVSPTRELVKEGKMVKISARSGDHQDRYIFLFSDIILLCSQRLIANRVIAGNGAIYKLRARFDVDNIQVLEGDNLVTANTFYIKDDKKCVELYTQTREEKRSWLEALYRTMEELYQKKSSLRVGIDRETLRPLDHEIGVVKPNVAPKAESCQKCMRCGHPFTMMRKKHQCRACGIVICSKCSNQKFPLAFEGNKLCRVCRTCYEVLVNNQKRMLSDAEKARAQSHEHQSIPENSIPDVAVRPKGLLEMV
ncbi:uncharacterized protein LOC131887187 isoform X2 [Tigriopus californicus]|uniref:uncharacterized protein LOC131887187 isoform X2 n=1 Tax=Tigriopus californicus TaxID=6832 RepID=UPI0027DAA46C|nr:uncharacterized protein LOC131887187 isoform X2 [Tigriopus californicus]